MLSAIVTGLLGSLLGLIGEWARLQQEKQAAAALASAQGLAADATLQAKAQAAMAQAVVAAPTTRQAVIDRLNAGSF